MMLFFKQNKNIPEINKEKRRSVIFLRINMDERKDTNAECVFFYGQERHYSLRPILIVILEK